MKCRESYEATSEFTISAACVWFTWQPLEDQCAWNFVLDIYRKICICNIFSRSCQSSNLTKVTCFVLKVLKTPNSPSSLPMVQFLIISFHSSWRNLVQRRRYKIEWLICTMYINVKNCFVSHDDILGELLLLDFTIICKLVLSISGWNLQKEQCRKQREGERKPCRQWKMSSQPEQVLAWPILGWPCLQFLARQPPQHSWQSAENS